MPIGDVGTSFGSVGGFFADSEYGYILESRKEPVIIRESGVMGETDFLYINNSAMHPEVKQAEWLKNDAENWEWDSHGGWHPSKFTMVKKLGGVSEIVKSVMRTGYENSFHRNQFLFNSLYAGIGKIDMEYIKNIYRQSGTIPSGNWDRITKSYNKTGKWGRITVGHASNALVTLMKPRNDGSGVYALCVGSAARGLAPMGPTFCTPIYDETNAFWELELAENPHLVANRARICAEKDLLAAKTHASCVKQNNGFLDYISGILDVADNELIKANTLLQTEGIEAEMSVYQYAKAIRYYTRCQVYARQAEQLLADIPKIR